MPKPGGLLSFKAESLRGLEVDQEFELRDLLHRKP
jgi:hypothetical protein